MQLIVQGGKPRHLGWIDIRGRILNVAHLPVGKVGKDVEFCSFNFVGPVRFTFGVELGWLDPLFPHEHFFNSFVVVIVLHGDEMPIHHLLGFKRNCHCAFDRGYPGKDSNLLELGFFSL